MPQAGESLTQIRDTMMRIAALDAEAMRSVRDRLDQLAKPRGSLGRLESLAAQLAGITGEPFPRFPTKAIILPIPTPLVPRRPMDDFFTRVSVRSAFIATTWTGI